MHDVWKESVDMSVPSHRGWASAKGGSMRSTLFLTGERLGKRLERGGMSGD